MSERRLGVVLQHLEPAGQREAANSNGFVKVEDVPRHYDKLRATFLTGRTRMYAWRREQLTILVNVLKKYKKELIEAVKKDFGKKHSFENTSTVSLAIAEAEELLHNFKKYATKEVVWSKVTQWPARSEIRKEPKGVVLSMSPWNYPVNLAVVPLAGAIAAGNSVFVKLSRHAPYTSSLLGRILQENLDPTAFVIEWDGGRDMISELLKHPWDHIFFTGSVDVGKKVMKSAAEHLASVTLELGGKNPVVVAPDANFDLAAKRITWGKFFNVAQTCVAPDYLLVVGQKTRDGVVEGMKKYIKQFYSDDPQKSESYGRIISASAFRRLRGLVDEGRRMGTILCGGQTDEEDKYVAPTLIELSVKDIREKKPKLMEEEIFGPILPVIVVESIEEAIRFIQERPHALALHAFSRNEKVLDRIFASTRSGSANGNDAALLTFANSNLPFGGVGYAGQGSYHGKGNFDVFTHYRATTVSTSSSLLDHVFHGFTYPPYRDYQTSLAEWVVHFGI